MMFYLSPPKREHKQNELTSGMSRFFSGKVLQELQTSSCTVKELKVAAF